MQKAQLELKCICERIPYWAMFFAWIQSYLRNEYPSLSKTTIELIEGDLVTPSAIANGEGDIGFTTPPVCAGMAYRGVGPYSKKMENLRAIGTFPHDDRMMWAVPADSGIYSIEDMKNKPLRLALPDEKGPVRFVVEKILEAYGTPLETLQNHGWEIIEEPGLFRIINLVAEGKADAVIHEGRKTNIWLQLAESKALRYLPIRDDVLQKMVDDYGYRRGVLSRGMLRGIEEDIPCIDFSGWMMFVSSDMDDDIAYRITRIFVERKEAFEYYFRGLPVEKSELVCPIDPHQVWRNVGEIPLHPAAERYYKEHGYM